MTKRIFYSRQTIETRFWENRKKKKLSYISNGWFTSK